MSNELNLTMHEGMLFKNILKCQQLICRIEIQINQPTRCNSFTSLLLDVYVSLNMFRAPQRPSSGAYNCIKNLWFYLGT